MSDDTAITDISTDAGTLARRAADWLVERAMSTEGRFTLALSGGSTPKLLYQLLASSDYIDRMPWSRTHLFWGDERFVAPDSKRSNYRMVRDAMLTKVPLKPEQIHPVPITTSPMLSAAHYERELKSFYGADVLEAARPLFDVTLLGLGTDGHTASLFPGTDALDEVERWATVSSAIAGTKPTVFEPRISLSFPALNSSRAAAFLVAGADKSAMLGKVMAGQGNLPAARIEPVGQLFWFLDRAAAEGLGE